MNGYYYIENTVDEYSCREQGSFETLDQAIEALAECNDWWRPNGTGTIYFQEFGLHKPAKEVYRAR